MTKPKSLLDGIGNQNVTEKYYDDWATNYDITLKKWKYEAPQKAVSVLLNIRKKFDYCLDLACGTGMFGEAIKKQFENITIDGCDSKPRPPRHCLPSQISKRMSKRAMPQINKPSLPDWLTSTQTSHSADPYIGKARNSFSFSIHGPGLGR